jgi:hypothetical protein
MGGLIRRAIIDLFAITSCAAVWSHSAAAQASRTTTLDFSTGSEFEDYLRVLEVAGLEAPVPWSIRGFSPRTIARLASADSAGPWSLRENFKNGLVEAGSLNLGATFNSAYPYGANDGPVWAGRGLTLIASGGVAGHLGPISFALAPKAFRASNRPFTLMPTKRPGPLAFANASYPDAVDLPQRFGDRPYSRLDPDASNIRFDSRLVSFGLSTGNEWIGPATEYPFLLGTNAPGFPHIFLGTGDPVNVWIARVQTRLMWGKLYQSDYSSVTDSLYFINPQIPGKIRLTTSAQIVLLPRGMPGLEVGFGRFFHVPYRRGEPKADFWKKPFRVFFTKNELAEGDTAGADNQLASVFFRWVFPHSGLEVYGERGYEDQFYDFREFLQNPDHERAYVLGFQKILRKRAHALDVLKAELINYQLPTAARYRFENAVYLHSTLRQGHTNRGQLLGASAGVAAAAASTISWTRYSASGSTGFTFRRIVRADAGDYPGNGMVNPRASDVLIAAGAERMRFGRFADYGAKLEVMDELNRNFAEDVWNLNIQLTARLHPW